VSRSAWRIATDSRDYEADDLSGTGARLSGGRWNEAGTPLVYASESRALACLETVVHLNSGGLPLNRYLVELEVPDDLWSAAEALTAETAPVGWDAQPASLASIRFGTEWARSRRSLLLLVPSAIVPEERNVLINPEHPHRPKLRARKIRRWLYDPRLHVG
jgi:RES domain-containing protein